MVNVLGVSQFDDVNVNGEPTWASSWSAGSARWAMMTTLPSGSASRTTVNVSVVPVSATDTVVVDSVNPAVSSSRFVMARVLSLTVS